jgi:hypothetical protein
MELAQGQKSCSLEIGVVDPTVVFAALSLELLAPQSHTHPFVKSAELRKARRERGSEIPLYPANDRIEFHDDVRLQVMATDGDFRPPADEGIFAVFPGLRTGFGASSLMLAETRFPSSPGPSVKEFIQTFELA